MLNKKPAIPSSRQAGRPTALRAFGFFLCNDFSLSDWEAAVTSQRERSRQSKRTISWMILCIVYALQM
jgi:hypothetical protein